MDKALEDFEIFNPIYKEIAEGILKGGRRKTKKICR